MPTVGRIDTHKGNQEEATREVRNQVAQKPREASVSGRNLRSWRARRVKLEHVSDLTPCAPPPPYSVKAITALAAKGHVSTLCTHRM